MCAQANVFGNPHSASPSSRKTDEKMEEVREMVMKKFNADPTDYQLVWVQSATGALKLTGETFPFSEGSVFRCAPGASSGFLQAYLK